MIRIASYLLRELAASETHSYVKLEICAECYFAFDDDLKADYNLILKEVCKVNELEAITAFIDGLAKIATTWEEKWLIELQKEYSGLTKMLKRIHPHVLQVISSDLCNEEKENLLDNTITNLLEPIVRDFRDLFLNTEAQVKKTPAGLKFWEKYGCKLLSLLDVILSSVRSEDDLEKKRLQFKTVNSFI
jgi:hypothetical protein